ncbi:hypothetical protein EDB19DRAFT_1718873 [Suillus lakei]|nr:hypothetical protein EDB19DRAFT_1718873 [Suillus lakei]
MFVNCISSHRRTHTIITITNYTLAFIPSTTFRSLSSRSFYELSISLTTGIWIQCTYVHLYYIIRTCKRKVVDICVAYVGLGCDLGLLFS